VASSVHVCFCCGQLCACLLLLWPALCMFASAVASSYCGVEAAGGGCHSKALACRYRLVGRVGCCSSSVRYLLSAYALTCAGQCLSVCCWRSSRRMLELIACKQHSWPAECHFAARKLGQQNFCIVCSCCSHYLGCTFSMAS
jgi:hypothetical protein